MSIITSLSKRKRIEALVRKSIENAVQADNYLSSSGQRIIDIVNSYVETSPQKYFDIGDDRKIAGLVLAYMLESSEIDLDEANQQGQQLLKLSAEADLREFKEIAPYTYEQLESHHLLASNPDNPDGR